MKLTARDRWIGWSREQKLRRLHLVTQNSRFVILPGFHAPNLASRVLGLSLRRLSDDMLAAHGYPVLVAETFVDPARFAGTCYRAANWRSLGMTGGYARQPGAAPDWLHHGQPKEILVFELQANAGAALRQPAEEPAWQGPARTAPLEAHRLRSLCEFLGTVPEYRHARGKRYSLRTVLVLAVAARLAGYRGVDGLRAVRRPAEPAAAPGRRLFLQPQPAVLHLPVDHDVPQHPRDPAAGDAGNRAGELGPPAERASRRSRAE